MTLQIVVLLLILLAAIVFFAFEWIAADVTGLLIVLALIFTGLITPEQAFAGFGSETVMLILGLLILTASLIKTGVVDMVGRNITRRTRQNPSSVLIVVMLGSAVLSAFMSNTAATAFFLPIIFGLARRMKISPSRLLMPLAFSAILASSVTLVSTSTNVVVSGLVTRYGMPPISMFELTPVGIPVLLIGLLYLYFFGQRFIPERIPARQRQDGYNLRSFLTEVIVLPESPLVGKTLEEAALGRDLGLNVLRIERDKQSTIAPRGNERLESGDELLVEGSREDLLKIKDTTGLDLQAEVKFPGFDNQEEDIGLAEVMVMPRSAMIGRTLKQLQFRHRYGIQVIAIDRHGETIHYRLNRAIFRMGDILLVQGAPEDIARLQDEQLFRVLEAVQRPNPNRHRAPIAIAIFVGSLAVATINLVTLPVAVLMGAVLAFITRCITPEEAYREVEWKVLILIGSMLALGAAMEETGAATYLAGQIINLSGSMNPLVLLSAFFFLAVALTQPMSNQAAAVVIVPVAIQAALQLDLNPRTFAIMIAVAASTSYLTPLEPACMLVYGAGRYRFMDFFKIGAPLTLLVFLVALLLVPLIWPL